jgi:hypothetical protein
MIDKQMKKRYKEFQDEYEVKNIKFKTPEGEIVTMEKIPVVIIPDAYFVLFTKDSVRVINWDYFISMEHKLDEKQMKMAIRTAESIRNDVKMFDREKPTHDMGVS